MSKHGLTAKRLVALACAWSLGACVHMTEMSDGQADILVGEDQDVRESLLVLPSQPAAPLSYGDSPRCTYTTSYTTRGAQMESFQYTEARRRTAEGRVIIGFQHERGAGMEVMNAAGERSIGWPGYQTGQGTALIDSTGALRDFNIFSTEHSRRINAENYTTDGAWTGRSSASARYVRRDLTLLIPHLLLQMPNPGDVTGHILDDRGQVWARYVYRGRVRYRDQDAILLDLMRDHVSDGRSQSVLVGFVVLKAGNLIPLYQTETSAGGPSRTILDRCSRQ